MRLSKIEKVRLAIDSARGRQSSSGPLDLEGLAATLVSPRRDPSKRQLGKTQKEFIFSPERIKWYTGPVGVGKSASLCASLIIPALLFPGSRWFIGRWTWWTLQETTLAEFWREVRRLGPNAVVDKVDGPPAKIYLATTDQETGKEAEPAEFVFHGLDDFEKLASTQFTGIGVDEANEIDRSMAVMLNSRLRHTRPGEDVPQGPFFFNMTSNPVRRSHWLHRHFCREEDCEPEAMGVKFHATREENEHNLPPGYYELAAAGMTPEERLRFIEGECGPDPMLGVGVFREDFDTNIHVGDFKYQRELPIVRSWDFGQRRPAVVWSQMQSGHHRRLACRLGRNTTLERFADQILAEGEQRFAGVPHFVDYCDPHGVQKRDVADRSSIDILRSKGIHPKFRDTSIEYRLTVMTRGLTTLVGGKPRSQFDRVGCAMLIEGYASGYVWPEPKFGQKLKEKPLADGFYEHLMDADGYAEVGLFGGPGTLPSNAPRSLRRIRNPETGY